VYWITQCFCPQICLMERCNRLRPVLNLQNMFFFVPIASKLIPKYMNLCNPSRGVFMKEIMLCNGSNEVLCWLTLNEVNMRRTLWLWEISEPCETKILWLITLDVRWYVRMFLRYVRVWNPYFCWQIENRRFSENRRTSPKLSIMISKLVNWLYSCLYCGMMINHWWLGV